MSVHAVYRSVDVKKYKSGVGSRPPFPSLPDGGFPIPMSWHLATNPSSWRISDNNKTEKKSPQIENMNN